MNKLTLSQAAELLGIKPEEARRLASEGFLEPDAGGGGISLSAAIRGYVRALREEAQRASTSAAASRLQAAKARAIELRNGEADGLLLDLAESTAIFSDAFGGWKSALYGLPARITRDIDVRHRIETAFNDALQRFTDETEARAKAAETEGATR